MLPCKHIHSIILFYFDLIHPNITKYFDITNRGIFIRSRLHTITSPNSKRFGSSGPHWAEEVIKQDATPVLSDSRNTDLLFLISDGGFYLPDKCQKYHSPSTITLVHEPTFPPLPSLPLLLPSFPSGLWTTELQGRHLQYRSCQSNCEFASVLRVSAQ